MPLNSFGTFFADNAAAIQAFAAVITLVLTAVLVVATILYVRATNRMVRLSQGQLRASFQPQILARLDEDWREDGTAFGALYLKNVGEHSLKIAEMHIYYYCATVQMTDTICDPEKFPLIAGRVIVAGEEVRFNFNINPLKDCLEHLTHDGACDWVFVVSMATQDIFGWEKYSYLYDKYHGLRHVRPPKPPGWWRIRKIRFSLWYKANVLRKAQRRR